MSLSQVPDWTVRQVKSWLVERGWRDVLFLHQIERRNIDGPFLLRLNSVQVSIILKADVRVPTHYKQCVTRDIVELQQTYRRQSCHDMSDHSRDYRRRRTNSDTRQQQRSQQGRDYNANGRGNVDYKFTQSVGFPTAI